MNKLSRIIIIACCLIGFVNTVQAYSPTLEQRKVVQQLVEFKDRVNELEKELEKEAMNNPQKFNEKKNEFNKISQKVSEIFNGKERQVLTGNISVDNDTKEIVSKELKEWKEGKKTTANVLKYLENLREKVPEA